jgi:uncharacterized protein
MDKILITGGSGMIGSRITELLLKKGYQVAHLGRSRKSGKVPSFIWDIPARKIEEGAFDGVTAIIHLAGANVGEKPWTKKRKQEILESRTHSTRLLFDYLKKTSVKDFISASAIGYYGFEDEHKTFKEDDAPGNDFLADVVKRWETEVDQVVSLGIRVAKVRVGIVLSEKEGALKEMARPVKYYVGAPLGSGEQKMSWIHIDDVCRVFIHALENKSITGAVNAVAPVPVTNRDLTKAIAKALGKPLILPAIPKIVLKGLLGEMADLVVKGNSVSNEKLKASGFEYKFPNLSEALKDLLR